MFLCLLWNLADSWHFFNLYAHNWMQKTELHLVQIQDLRLRDFWYSLLQTVCRFWLRSIDLCPFKIGWNIFLSSILVLIQMPFMIYLCYILTAWKLQKYVVKTQVHDYENCSSQKKVSTNCEATLHWDLKTW